jgi:dTDP-4-dehydrorhamnose reductase
MLKLGKEKDALSIVSDQIGSPTYAPDISEAVWKIIRRSIAGEIFKSGIYHVAGNGFTNWADFAKDIFEQAREIKHLDFNLKISKIEGIRTADYQTIAQRPLNSRLDQRKFSLTFGTQLPDWRASLNLCLKKLGSL